MIRIDARRVVAAVTDEHPIRDGANVGFVGKPVRPNHFPVTPYATVSLVVLSSLEDDAIAHFFPVWSGEVTEVGLTSSNMAGFATSPD